MSAKAKRELPMEGRVTIRALVMVAQGLVEEPEVNIEYTRGVCELVGRTIADVFGRGSTDSNASMVGERLGLRNAYKKFYGGLSNG